MSNVLDLAWYRYNKQLEREPLKTKAVTSGILAGISDITAQKLVSSRPLNWRRTLAMALFGLVYGGPSNHYWQDFTNKMLKGRKDNASVVKKLLLDNLVFSPVYNVLMMTYISAVVEGRSATYTRNKLTTDFPQLQLNSWKVWPLISICIYKYVPLKLRTLAVQLVALFWGTFVILRSRAATLPPVPHRP